MSGNATTAVASSPVDPRRLSGFLAILFLISSLIAIYEVVKTPRAFSTGADSSGTIRTIRSFYAGLNEFMETGDASALSKTLAPGALALEPAQGAIGDDFGLLTYLLALRSTLPELRYTIDRIEAGDDIAIASVRTSAAAGMPASGGPNAPKVTQEFFRVRDNRIVQHWTTTPDLTLMHAIDMRSIRTVVTEFRHLALAELTFASGAADPHLIHGPALIIVQRGRLTLMGDGSSQILDIATAATTVPGKNTSAAAEPGQAISILDRKALVRNSDPDAAHAYLATLVDDRRQTLLVMPEDRLSRSAAINDLSRMVSERMSILGSVTIRPLEFDFRSIPVGTWQLEIGWAVLGPGSSLPLNDGGEWTLAHVISGSASGVTLGQHADGTDSALTNDGDTPAVALVLWIRAPD